MFWRSRPLPEPGPPLPIDFPQRRATVIADATGQYASELNGYAKLNGDLDHYSKPRPNSAHADMHATTSSSSSDLLTPAPAVAGIDEPKCLKSGGGQHTSFHDDDYHLVCENELGGADEHTSPADFWIRIAGD